MRPELSGLADDLFDSREPFAALLLGIEVADALCRPVEHVHAVVRFKTEEGKFIVSKVS
ncbi:MAG: hypothetical protein AB2L09_01455 [Coriobacteriia bacterium]